MNPAALKTNVGDLPAGGALIVNSDAFTAANLNKAGYAANPLTDGSLKQYARVRDPDLDAQRAPLDGLDMTSKQKDLTKNFFALGIMFWLYGRDFEPPPLDRREVRQAAGRRRGQHAGAEGGLRASARRPRSSTPTTASRRPTCRPGRTATSPATRRRRSACSRLQARRPAALLRLVPDHAGLGHPPPAVGLQELRGQDVPGRGRDRRHRRRDRRGLWRRDGSDRVVRARDRPEVRGARPRGHGRAAARRDRRPAGRPVDRACRPRPSRRTCSRSSSAGTATRPLPVVAPATPGDCFDCAIEAWRIALKYVTPVVYSRTGSSRTAPSRGRSRRLDNLPGDLGRLLDRRGDGFKPVRARPEDAGPANGPSRARPGLEHRIGGIEKAEMSGRSSSEGIFHGSAPVARNASER